MARKALGPAGLTLVAAVRRALEECGRFTTVRVGVSGGADSMALALATQVALGKQWPDVQLEAMVVDHQLQARSAEVAAATTRALADRGICAVTEAVDVAALSDETGLTGEAAARFARYGALAGPWGNSDDPPDVVLLGHTLDDQAETVLLGLARGSGTRSLSGMAMITGEQPTYVRPFLGVRRATTLAACVEWGVTPWADPHNERLDFLRVRVRTELLPALDEAFGGGVAEALARTAALTRDDADLLDALASDQLAALTDADGRLDAVGLVARPPALKGRVVRQWCDGFGLGWLPYERTAAVLDLVDAWRGQAHIDLPGGARVRRIDGWLTLDR